MFYNKLSMPVASVAALFVSAICQAAETSYPLQDTPLSGGAGSVEQHDHNAYSLPQGNLPMTRRLDFSVGNSFFRNPWLSRLPALTPAMAWARCSIPIPARAVT